MADNVPITPGSGERVASREVTYSGQPAQVQAMGLTLLTGPDDGKTATDVSESAPLPVGVVGELAEATQALRMAVQALTRSGLGQAMPDTAMRLRVALDAISASLTLGTVTTVSGVTTVSTVTNQSQIGTLAANDHIPALIGVRADGLRANISVT